MTVDEAIEIIEWAIGGGYEVCTRVKSEKQKRIMQQQCNEAKTMAITALRAQQEAEKGCKYCRDGAVIGLDLCNDEITIDTDGKIHVMGGGDWELQINYCPMCGRQLRYPPKEAHDGADT